MEFNVLGPVTVTAGSESLPIGGPKPRTVLAMLVSRAGQRVTIEFIAQALYGEDAPERSRRLVQTYVSSLRKVVGDVIVKDGTGWCLTVDRGDVDATRFEGIYESALTLEPEASSEALRDALLMWRGPPYADVDANGLLDGEIARLSELLISVQQARIDADLETGRQADLIGEIEGLLTEHPYQERFRAQHMIALYRAGRQSDALRSYRQLRELLVDELGVEPSAELQDLEQRILEQDDSLSGLARPTVDSLAPSLSNLPVPANSLIGREMDVERIRTMLLDHGLVTLTGVGGCGKTRLAIEVARRELPNHPQGAYFADLTLVSDGDEVAPAVASAVRLDVGGADALARIADYLADKKALLVLDNCEHVIDACADLVEAVLERGESPRVLATSRELLDVDGEVVHQVPSLETGGDDAAAVDLFEARAMALDPTFVLDDTNRATVAELCEHLDGMPLAIELAAARSAVMSPQELLDRIGDRFRVLSGGRRRGRQRQRTLEATLDWSYGLLEPDEQHLLATLGVFSGPLDTAAAAGVAGLDVHTATDQLESLIAKSLVVPVREYGVTSFRLLETVRAYALDVLHRSGAMEETRNRHLDHYLSALAATAKAAESSFGAGFAWDWSTTRSWLSSASNVNAAIDWAIVTWRYADAGEILITAESVWREQVAQGPILERLDRVLAETPPAGELRDRLLVAEISLAQTSDHTARLEAAIERATRSTNETIRWAGTMFSAARAVMTDPAETLRLTQPVDTPYESMGERERIRSYVHMLAGEYEEALALVRPFAGRDIHYLMDATIAAYMLMAGEPRAALELADPYSTTELIWQPFGLTGGLCHLALGDRDRAERKLLTEARVAALGRTRMVANSALVGLAALAHYDGETEWARDIVLQTGLSRTMANTGLARMVAGRIGLLDEVIRLQEEAWVTGAEDTTEFLEETLARWDARSDP